jgi:hypothetical protein
LLAGGRALIEGLLRRGFRVVVADDGRLQVGPVGLLTPTIERAIRTYKPALLAIRHDLRARCVAQEWYGAPPA